ncbi:MAG: 2-C-methyl-D-erythritol 4-phosphate cytidylyltransferase [SAR324 cluster bacterium]|nr:2-C-methyl-D-erythritol 4-phosphate cytidylyltransferase [SAR324 cluster bacterium]
MGGQEAFVDILVLAAGKGTRMEAAINKMYLKIGGVPVLYRTLYRLNEVSIVRRIVVVIQEKERKDFQKMLIRYGKIEKIKGVVNGGIERHDSVRLGLKYIYQSPLSEIVMTHDGARPFVTATMLRKLAEKSLKKTIVIPVIGVNETVRKRENDGKSYIINRDLLFVTQTPQVFNIDDISNCFFAKGQQKEDFSDEAGYFENLGLDVTMVDGEKWNVKITTKEDLMWAEFLLSRNPELRLDRFD